MPTLLESQSSSLKPPIRLKDYQATLTKLYQSWSDLSPEEQMLVAQAVLEMESSRRRNPLALMIPNGAQEKVIREVGNLENFLVIACFANGVGKTSAMMAILSAIMWGAPTTAWDYPLYRQYPERWPRLVRIVTESGLVGHMGPIQTESKLWWPEGRYEWAKGGKQHNSLFITDTGFRGEVMTYEQAVKEFEGKTNAINLFVEPPPRDILFACFARQRKGGINLIDMTPLTTSAYIKDEIVDKPYIVMDGEIVGRAVCIHADIEENCEDHGKDGQLKHRDIIQMISRYDPDELEARAHGNFMHLSGRILKGFDRSVHVREFDILAGGVGHGMVVDPAIAKPLAILFRFVDGAGILHYYDELPEIPFEGAKDANLSVRDYVQLIRAKEEGRVMQSRILDRHFGNARRTLGGLSLKQELAEAGLEFTDSYTMDPASEVETGILKIKEYLKWDKARPIDSLNCPRIVIHPRCRNLIASLERWSRDPKTGKPKDEYKDFADCLRYDVMSNPEVETARAWTTGSGPAYGVNNG